MKKLLLLVYIAISTVLFSQERLEIFPDNLLIQPFTANIIEPKIGFLFHNNDNELRLDIGTSMDILRYKIGRDKTISFGADLFTYTKLREEDNFHFPVEAVDYLFGINFGYLKQFENYKIGCRLRLSHISAHLVDGRFEKTNGKWLNNRLPRVYSREFVEVFPFVSIGNLRAYMGFTYIYHIDPSHLGKKNYQFGFDYYLVDLLANYITPFVAYDQKYVKINNESWNKSLNVGIKLGKPNGKGISLYYHYYKGKSVHGEFYEYDKEYNAIGINLDL